MPVSTVTERAHRAATRMAAEVGSDLRDARRRRGWTLRQLADLTGLSPSTIQRLEAGMAGSLDSYARLATALGLRPELRLTDERRPGPVRAADPVHAAMGNIEAELLQRRQHPVALDEPYQHFQFAGRADVVAWDLPRRALLHIENRTRFPDLQDAFGSYNAKRAYLAARLAERLNLRGGFQSVTHALVALWSGEVLHTLRLRTASFRAACPDAPGPLIDWLEGRLPKLGTSSTFLLFDPIAAPGRRRWASLEEALVAAPRYRGCADAVAALGLP